MSLFAAPLKAGPPLFRQVSRSAPRSLRAPFLPSALGSRNFNLGSTHTRQLYPLHTSSSSKSRKTSPAKFEAPAQESSRSHFRTYASQSNPASTPTNMAELKVGDTFPEGVAFSYAPLSPENSEITSCGIPQKYDASAEFKNKKVVLVSVPGAFTPTCSVAHIPSFIENKEKLKAQGVDQVVVIAFNDAWVMSAWGKANGVKDDFIIFACDPEIKFSKSIGWFAGERTARYAITIDHGKVTYAAKEEAKGSIEQTGAEAVIAKL